MTDEVPAPPEAPAESALPMPAAWCRQVLQALQKQVLDAREAGHLEMLLTAFLEMNPSPAAFDDRLEMYAADSRPGIAAAASALHAAWRRLCQSSCPPLRLTDRLRVVGALLDELEAHAAYIELTERGARFEAWSPDAHVRQLNSYELHQENVSRSALRGQMSAERHDRTERHEARLRVVGSLLETAAPQQFWLVIAPGLIEVEGSEGYARSFCDSEPLKLASSAA